MWVFDATPLIYLAKTDRFVFVETLPGVRVTTERVYEEVVTDGLAAGYAGARRVERLVDDGTVSVRAAPTDGTFARLREAPGLSDADASVLALADAEDATAVVDERAAREVATVEGIDVRGTGFLLLRAVDDGVVGADEATAALDDLLAAGWYCAPDLYAELVGAFDALS